MKSFIIFFLRCYNCITGSIYRYFCCCCHKKICLPKESNDIIWLE